MMRGALWTATALLLTTTAAFAQDRVRSETYEGDATTTDAAEPQGACQSWDTGFEFTHCSRMPLPGTGGQFGQAYTLADGSRRILTEDPKAGQTSNPIAEAAETGDEVMPVSEPSATPERSAIESAIRTETATRSGGQEPEIVGASSEGDRAPSDDGEGQPEDKGSKEPTSDIVEKDFILPPVVATIPGRTEIMPVAIGHLNRIETPFSRPMVRTAADSNAVNVQFDHNFVYVAVTIPTTLFIYDEGYPDPTIAVSLVPQRIAPRQVKITVPPTMMQAIKQNAAKIAADARPAEAKTPRANTKGVTRTAEPGAAATNPLTKAIATFAHGKLPVGYARTSLANMTPDMFCSGGGVTYTFAQGAAITSNEYYIVRGMAKATRTVDLDERWCAKNPDTLAVAFAPRTQVGPDHPTDFYVLVRRPNAAIKTAR